MTNSIHAKGKHLLKKGLACATVSYVGTVHAKGKHLLKKGLACALCSSKQASSSRVTIRKLYSKRLVKDGKATIILDKMSHLDKNHVRAPNIG